MLVSYTQEQPSLEHMVECICTEAIASPSVFNVFSDIIPKAIDVIRDYIPSISSFTQTTEDRDTVYIRDKDRRKMLNTLSTFGFSTYEDLIITVPENFSGKFTLYNQVLINQSEEVLTEAKRILVDYNTDLSKYLTTLDFKTSIGSNATYYKAVKDRREKYIKAISFFYKGKNGTRQKLGNCIDQFRDLEEAFKQDEKLIEIKKRQNFKAISIEVQKCVDLLSLVKARLDDGSLKDTSGQVAKNISVGSFEVAKYVEYVALYAYYIDTAIAMYKNLTEQLTKIFVKK